VRVGRGRGQEGKEEREMGIKKGGEGGGGERKSGKGEGGREVE